MYKSRMVFSFIGSKSDVCFAVLRVLGAGSALSAKEVFAKLKREHSLAVSYRAVHKALSGMVKDRVLLVSDKKYSVSLEWLDSLEAFSRSIKREKSGNILSDLPAVLEFGSVAEVDHFLVDMSTKIAEVVPDGRNLFLRRCL